MAFLTPTEKKLVVERIRPISKDLETSTLKIHQFKEAMLDVNILPLFLFANLVLKDSNGALWHQPWKHFVEF